MEVVTKLGSNKEEKKKKVKDRQTRNIEPVALIPNDANPVNLRGDP